MASDFLRRALEAEPQATQATSNDFLRRALQQAVPTPTLRFGSVPPATVTQRPNIVGRFLDILARPGYAGANVLQRLVAAAGFTPEHPVSEAFQDWESFWRSITAPPVRWEALRDIPGAFVRGLKGEETGSGKEVAAALGLPETPIIPAFRNIPVLGATWQGAAGFAIEVMNPFDLTNYLGFGTLTDLGQAARATGTLAPTLAEQARAGQRALISFAGRSVAELPGALGRAGGALEEAAWRQIENLGRLSMQVQPIRTAVETLRPLGAGPAAAVRQRLRQRSVEEAYRTRQAIRRYAAERREVEEIAKKYGLDPEELRRTITREAQVRSREAITVTEDRPQGIPDMPLKVLQPPMISLEDNVPLPREELGTIRLRTPGDAAKAMSRMIIDELERMRQEVQEFTYERGGFMYEPGAPGEWIVRRWGAYSDSPQWFRDLRRSRKEVLRAFERQKGALFERLVLIADKRLSEGYSSPLLRVRVEPSPDYLYLKAIVADPEVWKRVTRTIPYRAWTTYTIQKGDTLSEIAQRFGTTVQELAERNRIADPNRIQAGQRIEVPVPWEVEPYIDDIREAQPVRLALERQLGIETPEFQSERIAYLHRELTPEARALKRQQREEVENFLRLNRPILTLRHGAQTPRHVAPDAYIHEVNQAALEGRTKWAWVIEPMEEGPQGRLPLETGGWAPPPPATRPRDELVADIARHGVREPEVGRRYRVLQVQMPLVEGVVTKVQTEFDGSRWATLRLDDGREYTYEIGRAHFRPMEPPEGVAAQAAEQAATPSATQATLPGTEPAGTFPGVTGQVVDSLDPAEGWVVRGNTAINREKGLQATRYIVITDEPQPKPALERIRWFSEDPAVIELARERMHIRTVTTAQALDDLIERGTREGWAVRVTTEEGRKAAIQQGMVEVTAPRFGEKLKGVFWDPAAAREIDRFLRLFTDREERNALAEAIQGLNRWLSRHTLFAIPEYHARNLGTGFIKNWYAGIRPSDPAYAYGNLFALYRQAERLATRSPQAEAIRDRLGKITIPTETGRRLSLQQIIDAYEANGLGFSYFSEQFGDVPVTAQRILQGEPFSWRRLNPLSAESYFIETGRTVGTFLEDWLRGTLFIDRLRKGYNMEQAANDVRVYHFDYADIPEWLKTSRDYATPFITWAYKNVPHEIAVALSQPRTYATVGKVARAAEWSQEDRPTQEEIEDTFLALPIYRGRDEQGRPKWSNLLNYWGALDLAEISEDGLRWLMGQLNALFQEPFEQAMNLDTFTLQPINPPELEAVGEQLPVPGLGAWLTRQLGGLLPESLQRWLPSARVEHALRTFRPYGIARRFIEPDLGMQGLRTLTGYAEYPGSPMANVGPFLDVDAAARYYQQRIAQLQREEREAMERGDERAALLARRQLEQVKQAARGFFQRFPNLLPGGAP